MTRTAFLYIWNTYANSNIDNLATILVDNHPPISVAEYKVSGKGIDMVDIAIPDSTERLTGFLLYGLRSYSQREYPEQCSEWFIPADEIKGISWKPTAVPNYVGQ